MPGFSKYALVGLALSGAALGHFDDVKRDMPGAPRLTKTDEVLLNKLRTLKHACKADHELMCSGARGPEALDCLVVNAGLVSDDCSFALEGFPLSGCVQDTAALCESFAPMTLGETFDCLRTQYDALSEQCQAGILKGMTELGIGGDSEVETETVAVETVPADDEAEAENEEVEAATFKKWKKTKRPGDDTSDDDEDCEEDPTTAPPATTARPTTRAPATTTAAPATTTAAPATTTAAPETTTAAPETTTAAPETTTAAPAPTDEGTGVVLPDPVSTAALFSGRDSDGNLKDWLKDLKDKKDKKKKKCKKGTDTDTDTDTDDDEYGKKKRWRHGFDAADAETERPSFGKVFGASALAGAGVVGVGVAGYAVAKKMRKQRKAAAVEKPSQYQEMSTRL
jgi:hypothetical protein